MSRGRRLGGFLILAIMLFLWIRYAFPIVQATYMAGNDFLSFYAGGRLAFTRDLYDAGRIQAVQKEAARMTDPALRFIRLPYQAALFWPLAQLRFPIACAIWHSLSLAALIGFVLLWRPPTPRETVLVVPFFMPTSAAILNGQDLNFLLLAIALAFRELRRDRPVTAGLWFSLCLAKYHLFVLFAVLILARRLWRFGLGAAAGAAAMIAASFAVNGWDWPARYLKVLADGSVHPYMERMPTLHAMFTSFALPKGLEYLTVALVVACVYFVVKRVELPYAFAVTLAAGPLVAWHAYLVDCGLLLPAGLAIFMMTRSLPIRALCVVAASPPILSLIRDGYPGTAATPLLMLALLGCIVVEVAQASACRVGTLADARAPRTAP